MAENNLKKRLVDGATSLMALMVGAGSAQAQAAPQWPEAVIIKPNPAADLLKAYEGRPPAGLTQLPIGACEPATRIDPKTKKSVPVIAADGKQAYRAPDNNTGICVDPTRSTDPKATELLAGPLAAFTVATQGLMNGNSRGGAPGQPLYNFVGLAQLASEDGKDLLNHRVNLRALGHKFDLTPTKADPQQGCWRADYQVRYQDMTTPDAKVKVITGVSQFCKSNRDGPR